MKDTKTPLDPFIAAANNLNQDIKKNTEKDLNAEAAQQETSILNHKKQNIEQDNKGK